jgi:hypothetical protein
MYIASLGHSGSTLLDLILGTHSSIVGLGEVGRAVDTTANTDPARSHGAGCSGGYHADDGRFWGRLLPRICEFLDIGYEPAMLVPERSTSHVIRGNRMRHDSRRRAVSYDPRWLLRREWLMPALLCRRIMRFNREQVYSNGLVEDWSC